MSDKEYKRKKAALEEAKAARSKTNAFEYTGVILSIVAFLLGAFALVCPPPWQVDKSVIELIGEFIGIIAIIFAYAAFKTGRDAKIKLRNAEITLDGDGDGKVEGESING